MHVVTIATDTQQAFLTRLLAPSCESVGLHLVILRPTTPWLGMSSKRPVLEKYLGQLGTRDELILFTDAYDTLFIRGEAHIREAYERCERPVVFSAEPNCWPLGVLGYGLYGARTPGKYPYLNSGGFIGRADALLELCRRYPEPPSSEFELLRHVREHGYDPDQKYSWSDQYFWTLVHLLDKETVGLDHAASIFECFAPSVPDMAPFELQKIASEWKAKGVEAPIYRQEYARLEEVLRVPSRAAQMHFASPVAKTVVLNMLAEERLPAWVTGVLGACSRSRSESVRVLDV